MPSSAACEGHNMMNNYPDLDVRREQCLVTFPYMALNQDELSLVQGQIVNIISKDVDEQGWWLGEVDNKQGVFPNNFVQLITEDKPSEQPSGRGPSETSLDQMLNIMGKESQKQTGSLDSVQSTSSTEKPNKPKPPPAQFKPSNNSLPRTASLSGADCLDGNRTFRAKSVFISAAATPTTATPVTVPAATTTTTVTKRFPAAVTNGVVAVELDGVEIKSEKLAHPTAARAKAPKRRPPSSALRENMKSRCNVDLDVFDEDDVKGDINENAQISDKIEEKAKKKHKRSLSSKLVGQLKDVFGFPSGTSHNKIDSKVPEEGPQQQQQQQQQQQPLVPKQQDFAPPVKKQPPPKPPQPTVLLRDSTVSMRSEDPKKAQWLNELKVTQQQRKTMLIDSPVAAAAASPVNKSGGHFKEEDSTKSKTDLESLQLVDRVRRLEGLLAGYEEKLKSLRQDLDSERSARKGLADELTLLRKTTTQR